MASYNVQPDISEKEKIVGGLLNMGQLFCLIVGLGSGAIFSFLLFPIIGTASIVLGVLIFIPLGALFAFKKVQGLTLFDYLKRKRHHKKIIKKLPNKRKNVDNIELLYISKNKSIQGGNK